jgi:hypothetical protein
LKISIQQIQLKFESLLSKEKTIDKPVGKDNEEISVTKLVERYSALFARLPPIPYLYLWNDTFFGFLHRLDGSRESLKQALEWMKLPEFENGMAAHAKLPDKPYLSGFHPFAFQHQTPEKMDTTHFDKMMIAQDDTVRYRACEEFKEQWKIKTGTQNQNMEHCPQCKVGVMTSYERRATLGADESAKPVRKCVNCNFQSKG